MLEKKLVPKLRFAEFDGVWEIKRLGEIAKFSKGKNLSKIDITEEGLNECVRYGELYTTYNETIDEIHSRTNLRLEDSVLSKANDIIIPASGETQLDIATASCVLKDNVILGGDLNIIRTKNSGVFLSYYLNSKKKIDIARLSQGSSVIHLYSSQLSLLKLNIPQLPEQQKIASFLTEVDTKLSQLSKKKVLLENYKKGVMQQIFSQELRFKDDDGNDYGDWHSSNIGNVFKSLKGKGIPKGDVINDGANKCVLYGELYTTYNEIISNVVSSTNSIDGLKSKKGDMLMPSSTTTTGIDLANVTALNFDNVSLGGDIIVLRAKKEINNVFYAYYLSNHKKYEIASRAQGITIVHIYFNSIKDLNIDVPSLKEQTKIASFLSDVDTKIDVLSTSIENTQTFKKGLLQQLFV
jgi:type I restriction enzyme S subunit